jgi:hypothetical protein
VQEIYLGAGHAVAAGGAALPAAREA